MGDSFVVWLGYHSSLRMVCGCTCTGCKLDENVKQSQFGKFLEQVDVNDVNLRASNLIGKLSERSQETGYLDLGLMSPEMGTDRQRRRNSHSHAMSLASLRGNKGVEVRDGVVARDLCTLRESA